MTNTLAADVRAACDAVPQVNGQVILAASEMSALQKTQPEWVWYGDGNSSFGRWQKAAGEAPYIRADLFLAALTTARAEATEAERERCAGVAEERVDRANRDFANPDKADERENNRRRVLVATAIANAIRAPTTQDKKGEEGS